MTHYIELSGFSVKQLYSAELPKGSMTSFRLTATVRRQSASHQHLSISPRVYLIDGMQCRRRDEVGVSNCSATLHGRFAYAIQTCVLQV